MKCLKGLPSKCLRGWQPGSCTKHKVGVVDVFVPNSDPLNVKTERRWNAERNTMAKKRLDRDEPGSTGRVHTSLWVVGAATQWT